MIRPERRVGGLGALLLIAAYGVVLATFGPERVVNFDPVGLAAFAAPAFVVGCVVAAIARWYVPAQQLTREAHRRAVTVMLLGPTALIGLGVALLAVLFGAGASALEEFEAMVDGGAGAFTAFTAFLFVGMLIVSLIVIVLLIVLLVVLGVVLQLVAVVGYGLATLALDRFDVIGPAGRAAGKPPD